MKYSKGTKLNKFRKAASGNRGSGIITVIVAMMFLFSIASSLLIVSYSGYTMKISQRKGNETAQDASTAMDEIRLGLQGVVSECMKDAYTSILKDYSVNYLAAQKKFAENFTTELYTYKIQIKNDDNTVQERQVFYNSHKNYDTQVLLSFVSVDTEDIKSEITIDASSNQVESNVTVSENKTEGKLILKDIVVTATQGKNSSTITADISIRIPSISSVLNIMTMDGIPEFAMIVKNEIIHNTLKNTVIDGCLYGGKMTLKSNSQFDVTGNSAVVGGLLDINGRYSDTPRFSTGSSTIFWADTIKVHIASCAKLIGTTLIANDLCLAGTDSKAILEGTYFGFGSSTTDASKSSSIFANGKNSVLDLTKLSELTLSGYSFIKDENNDEGYVPQNALMGESISSRENQRLYLVPVEHLQYKRKLDGGKPTGSYMEFNSNPQVFSTRDGFSKVQPYLKENIYLWTITEGGFSKSYKYEDYGAKVITMGMPYGNQSVGYYFLQFEATEKRTATENANMYFRHYFMNDPEKVEQYLSNYIVAYGNRNGVASKAAGNTILSEEIGGNLTFDLIQAMNGSETDSNTISNAMYERMFEAACTTLTYNEIEVGSNPYDYYIDDAYIKANVTDTVEYLSTDGSRKLVKIVHNENTPYTISEELDSNVALLIVTGDCIAAKGFSGTIFCGGTLTVDTENLASAPKAFTEAYSVLPVNPENDNLRMYFKNSPLKEEEWGDSGMSDVTKLVNYERWVKE